MLRSSVRGLRRKLSLREESSMDVLLTMWCFMLRHSARDF